MECIDLSEIADSYLSNELLVETNHEVIRHLEHCADCRGLLAERRKLRSRLRSAVVGSDESQIDPAFAAALRSELRGTVRRSARPFAGLRFAFAGLAVLLILALVAGILILSHEEAAEKALELPTPESSIVPPSGAAVIPAILTEVSGDAFDDHKDCALSHNLKELPISLEKAARTVDKVNLGFDRSVLDALREKFPGSVELIKAHYCLINGRHFTHAVVRVRKRTISVLMTKLGDTALDAVPAACGSDANLSSACFSSGGYGVFVVSDSGESETLLLANTISEAVVQHIYKNRVSA